MQRSGSSPLSEQEEDTVFVVVVVVDDDVQIISVASGSYDDELCSVVCSDLGLLI